MTEYEIDTNAGPIVRRRFASLAACRAFVERCIPLLRKRGYSCSWRESNGWQVIDVANSRGRVVHSAAFHRVAR